MTGSPMDIYAAPHVFARVGRRRRLNLQAMGQGAPTVVLAAGFMGGPLDWGLVQPALARLTRTVSFDNAGLGFSDPGPLARTTEAIARDLHAALTAADMAPPYVLVGHSAGGLRLRRFAELWPAEVCGMVLVDSVTEDWEHRLHAGPCPAVVGERNLFRRMLRLARAGALTPETPEYRERIAVPRPGLSPAVNAALHAMWTRPSYLATAVSESLHLGAAGRPAPPPAPLGDIPLLVLSAGRIGEAAGFLGPRGPQAWFEMHDELAALSPRGVRRTLDGGHNLPVECARELVAAIAEVLAQARAVT